jgi:conjugative relaxase-like TrwC/TraI family protein
VGAEQFAQLSEGQDPHTAEQLIQHRVVQEYQSADGKSVAPIGHRAGWDATFSAPKSVSLTALVGGDDRVREAHRAAASTALDELERYTQARIGGNRPAETTGQFVKPRLIASSTSFGLKHSSIRNFNKPRPLKPIEVAP